MNGTEDKVLGVIWDFAGEASISTIAKEARITPDYARLICRDLGRHDYINFVQDKMCYLRGKGKLEVAKAKVIDAKRRKIAIPEKPSKFGLSKNKRGRFTLEY